MCLRDLDHILLKGSSVVIGERALTTFRGTPFVCCMKKYSESLNKLHLDTMDLHNTLTRAVNQMETASLRALTSRRAALATQKKMIIMII